MAASGSTETTREMAQDGADITSPSTMPAGGWGIRGWLSSLYTLLRSGTITSRPYLYAIAEGEIEDHTVLRKLGENLAVSTDEIDLWGVASKINLPAEAMQMSVKSTDNTQDLPAGTGALTIGIKYLDASLVKQITFVTLNGTTWVDTTPIDIFRIQSFHVETAGSDGMPKGNITIVDKSTRAIVYDIIKAGSNRSSRAAWTVPAGKTLYVTNWSGGCSSGSGKYGLFKIKAQSHEGLLTELFHTHDSMLVEDNTVGKDSSIILIAPAGATVKISVKGSGSLSAVGHFFGWYE